LTEPTSRFCLLSSNTNIVFDGVRSRVTGRLGQVRSGKSPRLAPGFQYSWFLGCHRVLDSKNSVVPSQASMKELTILRHNHQMHGTAGGLPARDLSRYATTIDVRNIQSEDRQRCARADVLRLLIALRLGLLRQSGVHRRSHSCSAPSTERFSLHCVALRTTFLGRRIEF
jgi:hypothetical protein